MTERFDAIVVGAGHNGLVCAGYLARAGLKVACIEARETPGGMFAQRTLGNDYRLPGVAHASYPLGRRVRRDLKLDRHGYRPGRAIDTIALDAAGDHLVIGARAVEGPGLARDDARNYARLRREYRAFAMAMRPLYENRPPRLKGIGWDDRATLARLGWKLRVGLGRESTYEFLRVAGMNVHDVLDETLADDRLKGTLAADAVLGCAMGPRTPGSVLTWLQRLQGELAGALSVQAGDAGGPVDALTRSLQAAGGTIRLGRRVSRIRIDGDRTCGVELADGETLAATKVVSNVDPRATFLDLVGASRLDAMFANRVGQIRGSGTVAKLNLALRDLPGFVALDASRLGNRMLVAPSMSYVEHAFNASKYGEFPDNPVLEITLPSLHDEALAPHGHQVMSVNVAFAPCDLAGGWDAHRERAADRVISVLEQYAPGIGELVVHREFLSPADLETEYGAVQGHWHHGELTMHQSFMLRPLYGAARYDTPVDGLFLCGAGCHPGGGLSGMPGRNAARRMLESGIHT